MKRTFNYTQRRRILREEVRITLEEIEGQPPTFDAEFNFKEPFPPESRVYVEAFHRETMQRFDFGPVNGIRRPPSRLLDSLDLTGTVLFRVRVVDESKEVGRLLGAADQLRPEGWDDDENAESLMILRSRDLFSVPWRVEIFSDGSKPVLYVNSRIPDVLGRVRSDPAFYALILPAALQQVLRRIIADVPDEDDVEAVKQRDRWVSMATDLDSPPPESDDPEEVSAWIDRVVEGFCTRMDLVTKLNGHFEEV